ncbi:MAG: hypothetical protein JW940_09640 [Polyangiaceae bacterium]|nr:hypothetical protein [Polyangiaceae bacterium]
MARKSKGVPPWAWWFGCGIITVGMLAFYAGLAWRADHTDWWGQLGDAVAPFTSLITAFALFAALASVSLQRRELALQRHETRAARREMAKQGAQLERTAVAQEALAEAQRESTKAQKTANEYALRSSATAGAAILLECEAAIARILVDRRQVTQIPGFAERLDKAKDHLEKLLSEGVSRAGLLEKEIVDGEGNGDA